MCGFISLLRPFGPNPEETNQLVTATRIVRHRGPDDEGYLLWSSAAGARLYAGAETARTSRAAHRLGDLPALAVWQVAFGHRRLSIVDLSPAGHQPMSDARTGLAVIYNGEIYNFVELREELEALGHEFVGHSDTEVLLAAWAEWGPDCVRRLNGMFAFILLDPAAGVVHAVRDQFGIKPLYWARVGDHVVFASEIKQIRGLPGFSPRLDYSTVHDYLAEGRLDHTERTFDEQILQLRGGERATVRLDDPGLRVAVDRWYAPAASPWRGSDAEAIERFRELLTDSVRLRLRADTPVGSCLSGGLDSSSIVSLMRSLLDGQSDSASQITVTACFEDERYDEWGYAAEVVKQTSATPVRVWPTAEKLLREFSTQLWFMDEPYDGTSQFSQWCVFDGAARAGLRVVLDGQGSDELLGGYAGSTNIAFYEGLLRRGAVVAFLRETLAAVRSRRARGLPEIGLAVSNVFLTGTPIRARRRATEVDDSSWLKSVAASPRPPSPRNLSESLRRQVLESPLPALLRYEDRNSMAHSVEARVPFLDHRLAEFVGGLPDRLKIHGAVKKVILRESMRGIIPDSIRVRADKMGFATPELEWLRRCEASLVGASVRRAIDHAPELFDADGVLRMVRDVFDGNASPSPAPWRVFSLGHWLESAVSGRSPETAADVAVR